ncbi:DUF930 domain-containing protein [Brucella sp. BE17]|uniref:DUF930 domain-containing protein n=1 Tax=Brucella sp. BE17 TaxID=3142977 RepID=UPI0031BA0EE3
MKFIPALFSVFLLSLATVPVPVFAMNASMQAQLEKLDPETRLEQRCDVEAMERIAREHSNYDVDKALAYAFSDTVVKKNVLRADGAAFRSREHWYQLSYICKTDDAHIKVLSFEYKIGPEVPQSQWSKHYLVP